MGGSNGGTWRAGHSDNVWKTKLTTPEGQRLNATGWLLTLLSRPASADSSLFSFIIQTCLRCLASRLGQSAFYRSMTSAARTHLREHAEAAQELREERSDFQRAVLKLDYAVTLYWRLRHSLNAGDPDGFRCSWNIINAVQPVAQIRENASGEVTDEQIADIRRALVRYAAAADMAHFDPSPIRIRIIRVAIG